MGELITAARFQELLDGAEPREEEKEQFEQLKTWKHRSEAAKRAVVTKRRKYKQWPGNRN